MVRSGNTKRDARDFALLLRRSEVEREGCGGGASLRSTQRRLPAWRRHRPRVGSVLRRT
jgi:hypothetical protein